MGRQDELRARQAWGCEQRRREGGVLEMETVGARHASVRRPVRVRFDGAARLERRVGVLLWLALIAVLLGIGAR